MKEAVVAKIIWMKKIFEQWDSLYGSVSHKQAVNKATDEYKARTINDVEEDYLNCIKVLE